MPKQPVDRGVTRFKLRLCPYCGYAFDAAGTADGDEGAPEPGDAAICLACAEVMVFEAGNQFRKLTPDEVAAFRSDDPDWAEPRQHQAKLRSMQRMGLRTVQQRQDRDVPH